MSSNHPAGKVNVSGRVTVGSRSPNAELFRVINQARGADGLVFTWQAKRVSTLPATTNATVHLTLEWGARDAAFEANVDARFGGRLWLPATSLTVTAVHAGVGPDVQIVGSVTEGHCEDGRATFTVVSPTITSGQSRTYEIPAFAETLAVLPRLPAVGESFARVEWLRGQSGEYVTALGPTLAANGVPERVPGHADLLKITETDGNNLDLVLVWGLTL